jgi:5-methylcytosine-specific restriction endonuclease McrA
MNASSKAAYWMDPEKHRSASLAYRRENLDRIRAYDRERSKTRESPWASRIYSKGRQAIMDLFGKKCVKCGYDKYPEILQLDHRTPKSKTGASGDWYKVHRDALENPSKFQILCPNCHSLKTYRDLYESRTLGESGVQYRKKRLKVLALFGARCRECGYSNLHALHLDHKVPVFSHKRSIPATYEAARWPNRFQLLCYNCHVLKTIKDMADHRKSKAV